MIFLHLANDLIGNDSSQARAKECIGLILHAICVIQTSLWSIFWSSCCYSEQTHMHFDGLLLWSVCYWMSTCNGRDKARISARAATLLTLSSPSLRPRPGISTGQTWILAGNIIDHLHSKGKLSESHVSIKWYGGHKHAQDFIFIFVSATLHVCRYKIQTSPRMLVMGCKEI